jgi:RNA polymerase sigma-70 factor (family 1)
MQSISKHRIIPGFNKREQTATSWIFEYYKTPVYVIIQRLTKNSPETPDLVADTFLKLLQHENPFDNQRKLESYLYTTAKNNAIDHLRHQQTVKNISDEIAGYYISIHEESMQTAELSAAFHQLIQLGMDKLPSRCKEVFKLCYLEQLKNAEIAKRLGIKDKTVANLKIKAYKILRSEIARSNNSPLLDMLGILLL